MHITNLEGQYNIVGKNQDADGTTYKGVLTLQLDVNKRIIALWQIGDHQTQHGTGFFKNNILLINFSYKGNDALMYKGVVVYKCISSEILDGFWSEKQGNPLYLGEEQCFKLPKHNSLVN